MVEAVLLQGTWLSLETRICGIFFIFYFGKGEGEVAVHSCMTMSACWRSKLLSPICQSVLCRIFASSLNNTHSLHIVSTASDIFQVVEQFEI